MIDVLDPQDVLLRQFVDSIYIFRKGISRLAFTAYPSVNTPVGLFRNTAISIEKERILIENSEDPNHFAMACNLFYGSTKLEYLQLVDEIAVNFKPLGFVSFTGLKPANGTQLCFKKWNTFLPDLFNDVFAMNDLQQQRSCIEKTLIEQYVPLQNETILLKTIELLNDTTKDYKIQEIANLVGIHYKQLYRSFTENIGCSPAHYRKLVKFRTAVVSKINKGKSTRLTDICYENDYTDQSYFIKQFKDLTGEKPTRFFKEITAFGSDKVIFKIV